MPSDDETITSTMLTFSPVELAYLLGVLESQVHDSAEQEVLRNRLADRIAKAMVA